MDELQGCYFNESTLPRRQPTGKRDFYRFPGFETPLERVPHPEIDPSLDLEPTRVQLARRRQRGTIAKVTSTAAFEQHLRDLTWLRRVRDRIDREFAKPLDVEALASGVHMSAGHLSREFRLAYGESPYSYLMTRRIERAMALLRRGDLSVTEVCFAVGCSSLGTFSTRFSELVGMSPSAYRRMASESTAEMPSCVVKQVTRPVRNREVSVSMPHLA